jgi:phenylalanyl-tRNA synthetase beta chain
VDLKREIDLVEEVVRLYGVDKIPATPPRGAVGSNAYDTLHDTLADARRIMTGLGLNEAQGQTLISETSASLVTPELVRLANPLSSDMNVLRPSLLPGLLDALRHNVSRKNLEVALFELGRVFSPAASAAIPGKTPPPPREHRRLAIALTGRRQASFWSGSDRDATYDLYDLKGLLEEFLSHFGVRGHNYVRKTETAGLFLEAAAIQLGKFKLGELGQIPPTLARRYDLRDQVVLAELDLDQILARRATARNFAPLPAQPSIRRDVAMLVPDSTTHESVLQVVKQAKPANLESMELFDVFRGKNVPAGQKSLAYAFTFRHAERTLTDAEVNTAHQKLVEELKRGLTATIRE